MTILKSRAITYITKQKGHKMKKLNTKIYLDMDGVIADFFKAIEERYNVKHRKEIDIEQTILTLNK